MDNIIIINKKEYKLEKVFRQNINDKTKDSKGIIYPYPKEGHKWIDQDRFLKRLSLIEEILDVSNKYKKYKKSFDCLLCDKKNIATKRYIYDKVIWEDSLNHYIEVHNVEPHLAFKEFIYKTDLFDKFHSMNRNADIDLQTNIVKDDKIRLIGEEIKKRGEKYMKLDKNQIMILDALMIHGGYAKKYFDPANESLYRYSEHSGFLDFDHNALNKIVVSGKTNRVDAGDDEIYLPKNLDDMKDYEYIFHTHPPTPKPGGRAEIGILYEFPSIGDIFHFIDNHNDGNVIGSLVITPEGLYNIRKLMNDGKNIDINEDKMYKKYQRSFRSIQKHAIDKYGHNFTENKFYSIIAQDQDYINELSRALNEFDINIDFYPRKKDSADRWIIDTLFLVFRDNKFS